MKRNRLTRVGAVVVAATLGAGLSMTVATAALAHAEVDVEPAQALATDAVVTVFPEAHHHNAGVVSVEVFLPEGIAPADVTLLDGPDGWDITTGLESYTLQGDVLDIDVSPLHTISVRQLPDAEEIWFRILVTYSDGQVDRWIELPSDDNPSPSNAAAGAVLAEAGVQPEPTPTLEQEPEATTAPSPAADGDLAADADGGNTGLIVGIVVVGLLAAAGAAWAIARRGRAATGSTG